MVTVTLPDNQLDSLRRYITELSYATHLKSIKSAHPCVAPTRSLQEEHYVCEGAAAMELSSASIRLYCTCSIMSVLYEYIWKAASPC